MRLPAMSAGPVCSPRLGVLIDLAVLHDDDQVLGRILDQLDVGDWIPVDQQQIGKCALQSLLFSLNNASWLRFLLSACR